MRECGHHNRLVDKMVSSARAANIRDDTMPGLSPERVLREWSKTIKYCFDKQNRYVADPGNVLPALLETIKQQNSSTD